jgi:hypothetical protein
MLNSFGLGEIFMIILNVILIFIPIFLIWYLFKTLRNITRNGEQTALEVKKLHEEIQSLRETMPGNPPK